jgi:cold shock CspA family protein
VSKTEAIKNKNFFFTEEVTFENLDSKSKAEIIFGEKTTNYFDIPPPGKRPTPLMGYARFSNPFLGLDKPMLKTIDDQSSIVEEVDSNQSPKSRLSRKSRKTIASIASISNAKEGISVKTLSTVGDKKKHVILDEGNSRRMYGKLKFFDDNKNYGFITMESNGKDIFVHFGDLNKAGLSRDQLNDNKNWKNYKFEFTALTYIGKHNKSKKAVDLILL